MTSSSATDRQAASWQQFEDVLARLHDRARAALPARAFYQELLEESAAVLGGAGGALWVLRDAQTPELAAQWITRGADGLSLGPLVLRQQRAERAAAEGGGAAVPRGGNGAASVAEPTDPPAEIEQLFLAARLPPGAASAAGGGAAAVLEWFLPPAADALVRRGREEFLRAVAEQAGEFQAYQQLRRLSAADQLAQEKAALLVAAYGGASVDQCALAVATEGRRLLGCERLTVLVRRRGGWRVAAISGSDEPPQRGTLVRGMERLAACVDAWDEPLALGLETPAADAGARSAVAASELEELPPPLAAAATEHLERSHARSLVAVAARPRRNAPAGAAAGAATPGGIASGALLLLAEQFSAAADPQLGPLAWELAMLCDPPVAQAIEGERFPMGAARRVQRRLARLTAAGGLRPLAWLALAVGLAVAGGAVRRPYYVGAEAQLLPAERSEVFATADGVVAEIRAEHGEEVAQGDALVVLHAPDLQRDLQQASGNLATVRQRLAALQTARLDRRARERSDAGLLSLSAQQQEAEQQAADLAAQRDLLVQRAADLTLRSPRAGRVLTRDVQRTLANRPVRRGEALVTIANPQGPWELLAQAEQRHAGRLIAAWRRAEAEGVVVRGLYRLPGDVGPPRAARVAAISEVAAVGSDGLLDPGAPLEIRLVLDEPPADAARPGMHCEVKIDCGERPLAYVWFADLAAVLYRWWQL